jgi:hypothetical protein
MAVETLMTKPGDVQKIANAILTAAKAGEAWACRVWLHHVMPPPRGRTVQFALPPVKSAMDLPAVLVQVLALVAAGELTPQEGSEVASLADCLRASFELDELHQRVAELQARVALIEPVVH